MSKDTRYATIQDLILKGYISTLNEIFEKELISRSRVARDLGLNPARFSHTLKNPERFILKDLFAFAALLDVDRLTILKLVDNDYEANQKAKPKSKRK
jgi:hypothetical protein